MAGTTTFHLIRHASYDLLGQVLAGRSAGHSLNGRGRAEAAVLAASLAHLPIAAVVASPLERTRETAAPIAERLGLPVAIDGDVSEIDYGDWTGSPFGELHANAAWQRFNSFRGTAQIPGGETMLAAQARALRAVLRLRDVWPEHQIAVVTHGDVVKAVLAHFLAMPLDLMRRIEIFPASRSVVALHDTDAHVLGVNLPVPSS
jgi:broad specificity phosphatase PhoE